ncbi:EAL domain-containing protein [Oceanobacillus sp. CAU 1775]
MFSNTRTQDKLKKLLNERVQHTYSNLVKNSPSIFLIIGDSSGIILDVQGNVSKHIPLDKKNLIGKSFFDYIYAEDIVKAEQSMVRILNGETQQVTFRFSNGNGIAIPIGVTMIPIIDEKEVLGFYGLTHMISDDDPLFDENIESHDQLQSLTHHAAEIISIIDPKGIIKFHSLSVEAILGFTSEEMTGKNTFDFVHPEDALHAKELFNEILLRPNASFTMEIRMKHKNGDWRDFRVIYTNLLDNPNINGIVCNFDDITTIKTQEKEIRYMAFYDHLTRLPNRRAFKEKLALEIQLASVEQYKFSVLIFNIDGFKFLNDMRGEYFGDLLLVEVAKKINAVLHKDIEMLARLGADEFAILTKKIHTNEQVERIAQSILDIFEKPFLLNNYTLFLTVSVGISNYPESGKVSSSLMRNAGLALYLSEKAGYQKYHIFSPTANIETYKLFTLRNELRQAIHNNQFLIYYQPIIHGVSNEIVGVEALLRWNHPDWGIVSPNDFIPLAEESGLIIPLGEWVIKTVVKQIKQWHDNGYMIKSTVNLSLIQFLQVDLIDMISNTLKENELEPKWLTLELTETVMLEQKGSILEKINQLRQIGVLIALDDFGDGFSSFRNLKDVKPDFLKIDRSIVKDIPTDSDSTEMVSSIIQLAHRLNIAVIAEGVETTEQKEFLEKMNCNRLQGFLFSKPVPSEDIEKLLTKEVPTEQEVDLINNRRHYYRIEFPVPIIGKMTVSEINKKEVTIGNTNVLIANIGTEGLCFISNIKIPANESIILKFETTLLGKERIFYGAIVHESELDELNRYGVQFQMNEEEKVKLKEELSQLENRFNNEQYQASLPFTDEDTTRFFM